MFCFPGYSLIYSTRLIIQMLKIISWKTRFPSYSPTVHLICSHSRGTVGLYDGETVCFGQLPGGRADWVGEVFFLFLHFFQISAMMSGLLDRKSVV